MKKIIVGFCSFSIVPVLLLCCKKKERPSTPVDPLVKRYFSYKKGSYWIYKDRITGDMDSIFVSEAYTEIIDDNLERYDFEYSELSGIDPKIATRGCWILRDRIVEIRLYDISGLLSFAYPFPELTKFPVQLGPDSTQVIAVETSFSLNNNVFDTAIVIEKKYVYNPAGEDTFFINKDVGIIKMKLNHPSRNIDRTWELVKYKIVH